MMERTTALLMSRTPATRPAERMAASGDWFFNGSAPVSRGGSTIVRRRAGAVNVRQRPGERIANLAGNGHHGAHELDRRRAPRATASRRRGAATRRPPALDGGDARPPPDLHRARQRGAFRLP